MPMSSNSPEMSLQPNFPAIRLEAGIFTPFQNPGAEQPLSTARADVPSVSEAIGLPSGSGWLREAVPAAAPASAPRPVGGTPKRLMDVAIASVALVLAAPVMVAIAACTLATGGGPIIFAHRRVGFSGKTFDCYKFRTMRPDAAEALERYLADNPEAAREWRERKKLKYDPRVTLFGRLLRVSSLDELPQFLNVLRGEMSCIGPRPVIAEELQLYGGSAADYLSARPGITGLWQVSGRNSIGYADRVLLDSLYVRDWSVRRDLMILLRTAFAVIRVDHTS
jgi:exopolysaccharide production protein ExoY